MKAVCQYGVLWGFFTIFVLSPVSSDAGFLVEFHNGRVVRVEGYRTEGEAYELYLETGSFRVSGEEIKSIQENRDHLVGKPEEETEKNKPKTPVDPGEQKVSKIPGPPGAMIESIIKRKKELRERLEEAKNVYFTASDKFEKERARKAMTSFSRELFSLEAEVREKHNGSLPDWWKEN